MVIQSLQQQNILTVSQLTRSIKGMLEDEFRFVHVSGEISNLKTPISGHSYFTLKDAGSQLRGVLFKQQKKFQDVALKDGQQVVCFGRITVYEPRGDYQLIVDSITQQGSGQLQAQFERLKADYRAKGYFDTDRKQPLPALPGKIAVITSPTGAAIQDFLKIVRLRRAATHIVIIPARVQGTGAAEEIAKAIAKAHELDDVEIIVLCRGGGSLEDLWAFNEPVVVEAIHKATLPVVTGIGHEIDFTIADFCADYRSPTPTGAAEKIIPDSVYLLEKVATYRTTAIRRMTRILENYEQRLDRCSSTLSETRKIFSGLTYRLQLSIAYFSSAIRKALNREDQRTQELQQKLHSQAPLVRIITQESQLELLRTRMVNSMKDILHKGEEQLGRQAALLNSVSPLATLGRGYAIVRAHEEKGQSDSYQLIRHAEEAPVGSQVNIILHQGQLNCQVTEQILPAENND